MGIMGTLCKQEKLTQEEIARRQVLYNQASAIIVDKVNAFITGEDKKDILILNKYPEWKINRVLFGCDIYNQEIDMMEGIRFKDGELVRSFVHLHGQDFANLDNDISYTHLELLDEENVAYQLELMRQIESMI